MELLPPKMRGPDVRLDFWEDQECLERSSRERERECEGEGLTRSSVWGLGGRLNESGGRWNDY
jgi:hypothetical protein